MSPSPPRRPGGGARSGSRLHSAALDAADDERRWERPLRQASAVHYCLAILLSLVLIALILILALHPFTPSPLHPFTPSASRPFSRSSTDASRRTTQL